MTIDDSKPSRFVFARRAVIGLAGSPCLAQGKAPNWNGKPPADVYAAAPIPFFSTR